MDNNENALLFVIAALASKNKELNNSLKKQKETNKLLRSDYNENKKEKPL